MMVCFESTTSCCGNYYVSIISEVCHPENENVLLHSTIKSCKEFFIVLRVLEKEEKSLM